MLSKIITHPGGAHKDDFLACSVLLTLAPVPIERAAPSDEDLEDASVAVVDIGHRHEAERLNFDHHQFPRDLAPSCALSLVLTHLGLYEDAREFCEWLEVSEWLDCRGPVETAAWLGVEPEVLSKLNSPVDISLLKRFADGTHHRPGDPLWEMMRMIGQDLVDYIRTLRERLAFVAAQAQVWTVDAEGGSFKALFMPRTIPEPDEPSAGLGRHIKQLGLDDEILALVYPDRRSEGYGLRRYRDDPRLDFSRIDHEADVHFTHARGFIAKTSATRPERLKVLLSGAFLPG